MNKLEKLRKITVVLENGNVRLPCWVVTFINYDPESDQWDPYDDEEDYYFYGEDEEAKQEAYKCFQNPPEGTLEGLQRIEKTYDEFQTRFVIGSPEWHRWFEDLLDLIGEHNE